MLRKLSWLQVENRALTPEVHLLIQHWSHVIQVHFIVSVSFQFSSVVWHQKYLVSEAIVYRWLCTGRDGGNVGGGKQNKGKFTQKMNGRTRNVHSSGRQNWTSASHIWWNLVVDLSGDVKRHKRGSSEETNLQKSELRGERCWCYLLDTGSLLDVIKI